MMGEVLVVVIQLLHIVAATVVGKQVNVKLVNMAVLAKATQVARVIVSRKNVV
jgi:hypothetical protein